MKNNLSLKLLIIVAGFGYAPASWSAIECSTRLLNLPPNEFQSWVVQMSRSGQAVDPESSDTSGCADFILGDYPSLQFVSPGSDPLTASNYYIAALREFMDLLDNAGFDSQIADKLAEKRGSIEQNIDHFTNPESGQAGKLPGPNPKTGSAALQTSGPPNGPCLFSRAFSGFLRHEGLWTWQLSQL